MGLRAEDFPDRISTWPELAGLVEHFSYFAGHDWLFRGITDATYQLVPRIGRETTRARKSGARIPYRIEDERAVFTMFRQQARAHLQSTPGSPLEWLAVAQHFGLPTRLLDWTDSLFSAAWFAVEKAAAKKADSAIWVARGIPAVAIESKDDPFKLKQPRLYRPPHVSPRIAAQGSVFIICPKPTEEVKLPFARKITIDRSAEFLIKKRLNACGVNRRHLFPDLTGLTDHLTWLHKHDWLAGYGPKSYLTSKDTSDDTSSEMVE